MAKQEEENDLKLNPGNFLWFYFDIKKKTDWA